MFSPESKKTFYFPPVCACCGQKPHTTEKPITRTTSYRSGNYIYKTTYSIKVPVCQQCRSQHAVNSAIVVLLTLLLIGALVFVGLALAKANAFGENTFAVTGLGGIASTFLGYFLFRKLFNLDFAWIVGDGAALRFSNAEYQRQFDEYQTSRSLLPSFNLDKILAQLRSNAAR